MERGLETMKQQQARVYSDVAGWVGVETIDGERLSHLEVMM